MKQFYIEYWTKTGERVGITISALTGLDAKSYAEKMPNFIALVNYPKEVK